MHGRAARRSSWRWVLPGGGGTSWKWVAIRSGLVLHCGQEELVGDRRLFDAGCQHGRVLNAVLRVALALGEVGGTVRARPAAEAVGALVAGEPVIARLTIEHVIAAVATSVSLPSPPLSVSLPLPPQSRSLAPLPLMVLAPARPNIMSAPAVPLSVSFLSVPTNTVTGSVVVVCPSLTLSTMTAVPLFLAAAVTVSVRSAPLPPRTAFLVGTSVGLSLATLKVSPVSPPSSPTSRLMAPLALLSLNTRRPPRQSPAGCPACRSG